MADVAVLGAGAWGTALARLLAERGERVALWTWLASHAEAMARDRENREFFAGFTLPDGIEPTSDIERALDGSRLVVLVIPSHACRET
jgi:glycerol-3-phosphate dehydrogenase (NAD(P)+)